MGRHPGRHKKGPITWGDLYNVQPFGNVLTKLEIKGKDLREIINAQISPVYGPDYSISGFSYTWNPETGQAVDVKMADGTDIQPEKGYTVTVNQFMATAAGAKYGPIGKLGKNPVTGPEDLEATVDYVKSFSAPISYQTDGRIRTASDAETPDDTGNQPGSGETPGSTGPDKGEKPQTEKPAKKPDAAEQPDQTKKPKRPVVKEAASDTVQSIPESRTASAADSERSTEQTESGTQKGRPLPDTSAGSHQTALAGLVITGAGVYWLFRKKRGTRTR